MQDAESQAIEKRLRMLTKKLKLTSMADDEPLVCDDAYKKNDDMGRRLFVLTSSALYKEMDGEILEDHLKGDRKAGRALIKALTPDHPEYTFKLSDEEW